MANKLSGNDYKVVISNEVDGDFKEVHCLKNDSFEWTISLNEKREWLKETMLIMAKLAVNN